MHRIRLAGPWEYEALARLTLSPDGQVDTAAGPLPPAGRLTLPRDWGQTLGRDFRGFVRYRRQFNLPTNLEPQQRVWLALDGVDLTGSATLNGTRLGQWSGHSTPTRFDISQLLMPRNQLQVDVELPPLSYADEQALRPDRAGLPGGLVGEVRLEIEPPDECQST